MKRNFVLLIVLSIILVATSCMLNSSFPTVTPTFSSTIVLSSTPAVRNTFTLTSSSTVETEVPASPSVELPIGDGGLLSGQPCESPCFFGVRLGETKFDQVIPILKTNGLSPCFKDLRSAEWISVVCGVDKPRIRVDVHEDTLIVDGIWYLPSMSLSVGELVAKYGEPNRVGTLQARDVSNAWLMYATLSWDTLAMQVVLPKVEDAGEHIYQIENTTKVESISFSQEADYMKYSREESEAWQGYGVYKP